MLSIVELTPPTVPSGLGHFSRLYYVSMCETLQFYCTTEKKKSVIPGPDLHMICRCLGGTQRSACHLTVEVVSHQAEHVLPALDV